MNLRDFFWILAHRWWLITLCTALLLGGAYEYSHRQQRIYEATATVFAHPSGVKTPGDFNSDISLLTYGTLTQTFSSLAESQSLLTRSSAGMGLSQSDLARFAVSVVPVAGTTVLQISVDGPDAADVATLANKLSLATAAEISKYYHIFALTPLDAATIPTTPIRPTTTKNMEYGGFAGLILGFIVAALSLYIPRSLRASQSGEGDRTARVRDIDPVTLPKIRQREVVVASPDAGFEGHRTGPSSTFGPGSGAVPLVRRLSTDQLQSLNSTRHSDTVSEHGIEPETTRQSR